MQLKAYCKEFEMLFYLESPRDGYWFLSQYGGLLKLRDTNILAKVHLL